MTTEPLICPACGEEVWDGPVGHKLAKCWNYHPSTGGTLAFDTMEDELDDTPDDYMGCEVLP